MMIFTRFASCFLVSAVGGIGGALATASTSAYILDISDPDHKSRIQGIRTSFMALGEAVGPLLAVFISNRLAPQSMFMISAVIGIAVAFMVAIILRGKGQTEAAVESAPSLEPIPGTTNTGHEIVVPVRSERN